MVREILKPNDNDFSLLSILGFGSTSTSGGLFGQNTGGGLFGAKTTQSIFGGTNTCSSTGFGGFGGTSGGLFGGTSSTGTVCIY